jgi:hypothetical protein
MGRKRLAIQAIEQLFNSPVRPVENTDLAQYILTHTYSGPSKTLSADIASKQGAESEGSSFLSKTFDLLSAGLYGTTNVVDDMISSVKASKDAHDNPLEAIGRGIGEGAKSIGENTLGTLSRGVSDVADMAGQVTGLDKAPIIGGLQNKIESSTADLADKLTPRKMGSTVLDEQFGVKNKFAKYGGGFALDVALDPISYVPGLNVISTIKKGREAKRIEQGFRTDDMLAADKLDSAAASGTTPGSSSVPSSFKLPSPTEFPRPRPTAEMATGRSLIPAPTRQFIPEPPAPIVSDKPGLLQSVLGSPNAEDLTDLQALRRSDNATRAANVRWGKPADWHEIPEMSRQEKATWSDNMIQAKMAKKGVVSDGKGRISIQSADNVLENIRQGNIPRFGPQPAAAEGFAAEHAVGVANKFASNLDKPARKGLSNKILTPADQENLYNSVYNAAAKLVNEQYATRAAKKIAAREAKPVRLPAALNAYVQNIAEYSKSLGRPATREEVENYLTDAVKAGYLNTKESGKVIRHLFPKKSEPIQNYASTRFGKQATTALARQMLRSAEDHLISQGVKPTYWNGMGVRLSEILEDVGAPAGFGKEIKSIMEAFVTKDAQKILDPTVREAVEKALARRSLSMSDILSGLSEKTLQVKKDALAGFKGPEPVAKQLLDRLPQQARESAESIGATSVESKAMADHVRSILDSNRLPEERLLDTLGRDTAKALMEGRSTREEIVKASRLISRMLDETPAQASKDVVGNKAIDGFFARMSTWKGRPEEIKRFSQDAFLYAEVNASARATLLRHMSKEYTPEELNRGFNLARQPEQLRLVSEGLETDPKVLETANVFKNYFDWMLGSTGFDKLEDLAGVTSVKSSMIMTDVNRHLKAVGSKFQFIDAKKGAFKHTGGEISRDYSQRGIGWMRSWENSTPSEFGQDPISFMYDMDLAIQRTVAEYATFDEFARRFGAQVGDSHYNAAVHKAIIPNPRLAGYKFHPLIQQEMLRLIKDLETGSWMPSSPVMRQVIKGTRVWKSSVTIYRPIHHIRNVIGDSFNMWIAGHNNPTAFTRALKVLETQKPRYAEALKSNSMENLKTLIDADSLRAMSLLKPEVKASDAIIKKAGVKLDSEQLWSSGYKRGLFLSYNRIEDLFGQTPMGNLFGTTPEKSVMKTLAAPFGGRAHAVASKISEHREHYVRMAHYIAAVEKQLGKKGPKDIEKIFDEAAHEVRKYHPDGSDLTQFEQKTRVLIPFYAWTRKEIPLLMQAMVERPAKLVAMPRAERAVAGMSGIDVNEEKGMLDPYPDDQLFPDWIRASGIGPIGDPESDNPVARFWASFGAKTMGIDGPEGYVSINPSNPFQDVTTQLMGFGNPQDSMRGLLNSMNPGVQIPASLAFDKTFSGAPISAEEGGEGVTSYLLRQIPQIGEFSRLSGVARNDNEMTEDKTKQNLINFLSGLGVLGSGPYQKSAEFEAKDRARNASTNR